MTPLLLGAGPVEVKVETTPSRVVDITSNTLLPIAHDVSKPASDKFLAYIRVRSEIRRPMAISY